MSTENPDFLKNANIPVNSLGKQRWKGVYRRVKQDFRKHSCRFSRSCCHQNGFTFQVEKTFLVGKGFENPGFCEIENDKH